MKNKLAIEMKNSKKITKINFIHNKLHSIKSYTSICPVVDYKKKAGHNLKN